ncbi:PP2C family protein-serine/threonine phosphatase [Patulibacter sp. S7RM1-6]
MTSDERDPIADADRRSAPRRQRSDAALNYTRLVSAAMTVLREDPEASMERIAEVAQVGRATAYRHFPRRSDLVAAAAQQARDDAEANERDALRPAGELAATVPAALDVADVLNKVPPYLLGEQLVAEATRLADAASVALYVVDIDGSRLLRLAGAGEFPDELPLSMAVGPELPRSAIASLRHLVEARLPRAAMVPMYLRGRAIGVLIALGAREETLQDLARQGAAALQLASRYTDVFEMAMRRRRITAASEIQQNLLPPRVARIGGAGLAGNVLPTYEVGGDWFDYVENPDGAWIGVADVIGTGTRAAGLAAVLLGAFRAARRNDGGLHEASRLLHETLTDLGDPHARSTAIVARWQAATATFSWINHGHEAPILVTADGRAELLREPVGPALGDASRDGAPEVGMRRLAPDDRLILCSDGVTERPVAGGGLFGTDGVIAAARTAANATAASTVNAIEEALLAATKDPLHDDATIVVLAPTGAGSAAR